LAPDESLEETLLMRRFFVFSVLTVALAQAEGPVVSGTGRQAQVTVIPSSAVPAAPYLFRYTDQYGKSWFYRQTPFGVVSYPEQPVAAPKDPEPDGIRATEDGEAVRFERLGPFGVYHWRRNKSELDAGEQAAWDRERARVNAKRD
jgi:hypothetical protein